MAGRDLGDWSVALWYDHGDPAKSLAQKKHRWPDQEVYIVGLTGPKNKVDAFGHEFLNFLRQSGVFLVQGENDRKFVRLWTALHHNPRNFRCVIVRDFVATR